MRASFVLSLCFAVAGIVACGTRPDVVCEDGGVLDDDGVCGPDANQESDGDPDGGSKTPVTDEGDCLTLVVKACGAVEECDADPGCRAASLLSQFQPEGCAAALGDNRGYPACAVGSCAELVDKVCGPDDGCSADAACEPALVLRERADDGDTSATASCGQALADEVVFPRCVD